MVGAKLVRKISTKEIGLSAPILESLVKEDKDAVISIMRVYGNVSKFTLKTTTLGDSYAFGGSFEAVNLVSGEKFRSSTCYLPQIAESMLTPFIDPMEKAGSLENAIQFGVDVSIVFNPASLTQGGRPYKYVCTSLVDSGQKDALDLLGESLPQPQKQLEGPKTKSKKFGVKV